MDTTPLIDTIVSVAKQNNMTLLRQVGGCFTLSSLMEMFTGKLPCDLLENGIGAWTYSIYWNYWTSLVRYPWANELIPVKFVNADWRVYIHNFHNFKHFIDAHPYYRCSHTFPIPMTTAISKDFILNQSEFMHECYENEASFIHSIQADKPKKNSVYFVCWDQFHYDLISSDISPDGHKEGPAPEDRLRELLAHFDFTEPNAMFWIFTDHGDWTINNLYNGFPDPNHYLTWAFVKDNIPPSIEVNSKFISIRDFYPTIINKFGLSKDPLQNYYGNFPITAHQNKDRIYFVEDGRDHIDRLHCTSAVSCKFVNWIGDRPKGILQVAYHKPIDKFAGLRIDLDDLGSPNTITEVDIDLPLKEALTSRIRWMKHENNSFSSTA